MCGCAAPRDCFAPGTTRLAAVTCLAEGGDQAAQLTLGKLYEAGAGVPRDPARAAVLYEAAAAFRSGTTFVYVPPVGRHQAGTVTPIRTGPDQAGLPEAKYRLALLLLRGDGVRLDIARGLRLLREAAEAGFLPAKIELQRRSIGEPT